MPKTVNTKTHTTSLWADGKRRTNPPPVATSQFRNWPSMLAHWCQGGPDPGGASTTAGREEFARTDVCVMRGQWPAEYQKEFNNITAIKAIRSGVKIAPYTDPRFSFETDVNGSTWYHWQTMQTVSNWRLRDVSGNALFYGQGPAAAGNMAVHLAGLDGQGRRFSQALADRLSTEFTSTYDREAVYSGIALDDWNLIDAAAQSNGTRVNPDYEQNGVADVVTDNTVPTGGAHKFRTGLVQLVADYRAKWPSWFIWANSDYGFPYAQSPPDRPPAPPTSLEVSKLVDILLVEESLKYRARIGDPEVHNNDHVYPFGGLPGNQEFWMTLAVNDLVSRADNESALGRKCYALFERVAVPATSTAQTIDYHFARLSKAISMSVEGAGYGVNWNGANKPFWIDENAIDFGAPIGTRSMGTLNQNSGSAFTFTLRVANHTGAGGEKFYWTEYQNALVLLRWDNIGITANVSVLGDGSTVSCPLPSAGAGYRWDEFNAATYVNPTHNDLAMRAQDTSWNGGATNITAVSLKPYHAKFLRRVPV